MFSKIFIDRPILASVLALFILLAGSLAMRALPVEQYPNMVPSQVNVTASYPGASPETIAATVAAPLEQQINGVEDMLYMTSVSDSSGNLSISVAFDVDADADMAVVNVNNRIQPVLNSLPEEVRRLGVTVQKRSAAILMVISLYSPDGRYDSTYISNYTLVNIMDELKRLPGVGDAINFGARYYSMRIWTKPDRMAQLGLVPSDITAAIQEQNAQFVAGNIGQNPLDKPVELSYIVSTKGRLSTPQEFENIVLRSNPDGTVLRLKDVARVELGSQDYSFIGKLGEIPASPVGIFLVPGGNALSTAEAVIAKMEELKARFPAGIDYAVPYDTTKFVKVSIKEVVQTLLEAMVLVFAVVYLFLQNWRATIIPCLVVPVSIVGTFAGMYILGFSINTLTLFGMVLAIGIVVDDAIVVLENVERIMRTEKLEAREATIKAMEEVSGALIAIVLVLCSVFIPVAFLGGLSGIMYKQFAITIAVSVSLSGLLALTFTPALCALMLSQEHISHSPKGFFKWFNAWFEKRTNSYVGRVRGFLHRIPMGIALTAVFCAAALFLFKIVPTSMVPNEDQGIFIGSIMMPSGTSIQRTEATAGKFVKYLESDKNIDKIMALIGYDIITGGTRSDRATFFIALKDWDLRTEADQSVDAIIGRALNFGKTVPEGLVIAFNMPPISGMSNTGGFEAYLQNRGSGGSQALAAQAAAFAAEANKDPMLLGVNSSFSASSPQLYIDLDRDMAKSLGVSISKIFNATQNTFGVGYVNDINLVGRTYRVQIQADKQYRAHPENLDELYVRSDTTGAMIALSSIATVKEVTGPNQVQRYNIFQAAKITGGPAPGHSSGDAIAAMERAASKLPPEFTLGWVGTAYQEKLTGAASASVFVLGLIMVFLILAAQYEKWTLPFAVLFAVPFAIFGAIGLTWLRGLNNDVYFQIALVTLIGLAAKNAILIVEFALEQWEKGGKDLFESALTGARLRFRPIVMTSLAFILGCVPLAISTGAGANSRHAIGTGVIGGMLAATFIATNFIPMFFVLVMGANTWIKKRGERAKAKREAKIRALELKENK